MASALLNQARDIIFNVWGYRLARVVLGCLFIYAGSLKLMDVYGFAYLISEYKLVPDQFLVQVAYGLPVIEILAGLGLIVDLSGSLAMITALLLLFIGVLYYGVVKGLDIDCGCFGPEEQGNIDTLKLAFTRDLWMLAACIYAFACRWINPRIKPLPLWPFGRKAKPGTPDA